MHNAHRAKIPVFVIAGLAPVTHDAFPGSRDLPVHYFQDVFDQPGIVREYTRWMAEYRQPSDPAELVERGLERATATPAGPVYLAATREALETPVDLTRHTELDGPRTVRATAPDPETVRQVAERVRTARYPLVITTDLGAPPDVTGRVDALVSFAETAGAGVVEQSPSALCFPRDHDLHAGFEPTAAFDHADLILLASTDVPLVPSSGHPGDVPVVQIDPEPTTATYPQWPFDVDDTIVADTARTLSAVADRLSVDAGTTGRQHWRDIATERRADARARLREAQQAGRLTPDVLSAAIDTVVDEESVVLAHAVTSNPSILEHVELTRPGSFFTNGGSGLGWAGGAAVGVKLAHPDRQVISLIGDGSYLFSHPTACAWMAAEHDAPTLTVIYDNAGWNAVASATDTQHPDGAAIEAGVPESQFDTDLDLTAPARAVDAFTRRVERPDELEAALAESVEAVAEGRPAVVSVATERPVSR